MTKLIAISGGAAILASAITGAKAEYTHETKSEVIIPSTFDPDNRPAVMVAESSTFRVGLRLTYSDAKGKTHYTPVVASIDIAGGVDSTGTVAYQESNAYKAIPEVDPKDKDVKPRKQIDLRVQRILQYLEASTQTRTMQGPTGPVEVQSTTEADLVEFNKRVAYLKKHLTTHTSVELDISQLPKEAVDLLEGHFAKLVADWNSANG